ncbi:MAG: tail fiber domain-containing protein [Bacteroidales bacterium]
MGNGSVTSIGGAVSWSNYSDKRFKRNVKEDVPGLGFVMQLRPVTYNFDVTALDDHFNVPDSLRNSEFFVRSNAEKEAKIQTGFITQEVEEAALAMGFEFSGVDKPQNDNGVYSLRYAEFVVPLVKAVQEQQAIIKQLEARIEELENNE